MNYTERKKERKLKKKLISIYNITLLKWIHLSLAEKVTILWCIIGCISFFLPWIIEKEKNLSWNAFSSIWGNTGWIMILCIFFTLFIIISNNIREKLKLSLWISFKNHTVTIFMGVIILFTSCVYVSMINGLYIFLENISIGNGVIFYIISWLICIIWGILDKKQNSQNEHESFIHEKQNNNEDISAHNKKNMKLPF